ncbi:MAG: type II toxin-antitoxin system VapC family toxin [Candidatus Dormibacteraceae bacterium]
MTLRLHDRPEVVIDASVVIALLVDESEVGEWATSSLAGVRLLAPDLMPYEVTNTLRRHVFRGMIDISTAVSAHLDLTESSFELYPYSSLAERIWELRENLTSYDAAYVALAELMNAPLITLDSRIGRATGPHCRIITFPEVI